MSHYKRKHPHPEKNTPWGPHPRNEPTPLPPQEELPPTPAKLPKGYCKRGKGPHVFVFDHQVGVSRSHYYYQVFLCTTCGKKRIDLYFFGKLST